MTRKPFKIGDPVPWFHGRTSANNAFHFETAAGRYVVLCFYGTASGGRTAEAIRKVTEESRKLFNDHSLTFFGVSIDPNDEARQRVQDAIPGIRHFWDFDLKISKGFGALDAKAEEKSAVTYNPFTLVLDPLLRVIANIPIQSADQHQKQLMQLLKSLPKPDLHAGVPTPAPVLVLPRVFEPEFCRKLIDIYNTQGGKESGFMREKEGKTIGMIDYGFKRRKDFTFDRLPEFDSLRAEIRDRINRRLVPEVKKAFQYKATRIERYIVACYEGDVGGFFRAHRDNTTKGTAHRQFACSINLNADEFEGGNLRFPEFGSQTYRAPTGGAVVFSCSLLHEATPVTKGTRYAFLPFLYNDEKAQIRKENRQFLSGEVLNKNAQTNEN